MYTTIGRRHSTANFASLSNDYKGMFWLMYLIRQRYEQLMRSEKVVVDEHMRGTV